MNNQTPEQIHCWIYRSSKKQEMYLYLAEEDGFEALPEALKKGFGHPERVIELDLHPERPLAREDVLTVMHQLHEQGFYLQMPPKLEPELYEGERAL